MQLLQVSAFHAQIAGKLSYPTVSDPKMSMEVPDDLAGGKYLDGLPLLRDLTEEDWSIIEHLADLPRRRGDVLNSCCTTAERCRQILEWHGEMILSVVGHLACLRTEDVLDAIEAIDCGVPLIDALITRKLEGLQESPTSRVSRAAEKAEEQWHAARAEPAATVEAVQAEMIGVELLQAADRRLLLERVGRMLGLQGVSGMKVGELQGGIDERLGELLSISMSTAPSMAAEPSPRELLHADALEHASDPPTTRASIERWEQRGGSDQGADWRRWFRLPTDFTLGHQAVNTIAEVVGVSVAEVEAHGAAIAEREAKDRAEVAAAWVDAEALLTDAVTATGWEWLSAAAGVSPAVLIERYQELTSGQPSR